MKNRIAPLILLATAFLCSGPRLLGQTSDTQPPVLTNLTINPLSVDVTTNAQTFTVQISATDNLSGLNQGYVTLTSPSGGQYSQGWAQWQTSPRLLSGSATALVQIPRYAEPGLWNISVVLYDQTQNAASYSSAVLQSAGQPAAVTVIDTTPDLTAPQLYGISMPSALTVGTQGSGSVTFGVQLTIGDAQSGFSTMRTGIDFQISSPSGKQSLYASLRDFTLVSGTPQYGVWQATLQLPKYAEAGTWKVTSVVLRDAANNIRYYTPATLSSFGTAINLAVTSSVQDLTPPTITALRFIPALVNTSLGGQSVAVEMDASDDLAGLWFAPTTPWVSWIYGPYMISPSGTQHGYVSPYGGWALTGTVLSGTWRGSFYLPQYSEEGTWGVQTLRLEDAAHNTVSLNRSGLTALGIGSTFDVIKPSLLADGAVSSSGGTVQDSQFGTRASVTFAPGAVSTSTTVAIDVLQSPLSVPLPTGFSGADTLFVNIQLSPEPAFPLPPPGLTVVLPLKVQHTPGSALYLYRINASTGLLEPSLNTSGIPVVGYVDAAGNSATFTGISRLSTVVGLKAGPIQLQIDVKPGDVVNAINSKAQGVIPVLIYGTPTLDASKIDAYTLRFLGAAVSMNPNGKLNTTEGDFNGDGYTDLMAHFDAQAAQMAAGQTIARLDGSTLDSRVIWGQDTIVVVH